MPASRVTHVSLVGTVEACQIIGIERSTLSRWVQLGKIAPAMKLPGRTGAMLFDRTVIEAFAAKLRDDESSAA